MPIEMSKCKKCGVANPSTYKKCAFCHHALEPAKIDPDTNPAPGSGPGQYATTSPLLDSVKSGL